MSILKLENLGYRYEKEKKNVLSNVNLSFENGKIYAIVGKSGAGKTTLLSLLSGLASPTEGKIIYDGNDTAKIDKYKYRSQCVGVVFQSFNLLPKLTALENVVLSMDIAGVRDKNKKDAALELLEKVGIDSEESERRILKLSGGQQQRVAIARTLSYNPQVILADEPTGNLDSETAAEIMNIFRMLADEGKCIVLVTHSAAIAKMADACFELKSIKAAK